MNRMPKPQLLMSQCAEILGENPFECPVARDIIERNLPLRLVKFTLPAQVQILLQEPERIIAGYANIEVIDSQGELIPSEVWPSAFGKFMSNPKFRLVHVFHTDIPVGEVIWEYSDTKNHVWKSHTDDTGLFVVVKLRKDLIAADRVWDAILRNELRAFSISGLALERRVECSGGRCYRVIPRLELHSITICEKGANLGAIFTVVKGNIPASLLRIESKASRQKMSEERPLEEMLEESQNQGEETLTGKEPGAEQVPESASKTVTTETRKEGETSKEGQDISPMLLAIKAGIESLAGKMEAFMIEFGKARKPEKYPPPGKKAKPDEEEEDEEEKARRRREEEEKQYRGPGKYPYPERYPYPGKKAKKPGEEDEEEDEEEKARRRREEEEKARRKLPFPPPGARKGEFLAISEEDLGKMIEEKAAAIAETKVKELLEKALPKTQKRGEVPSIGGPAEKTGLQGIMEMPLAKIGTMPRPDFLKVLKGGS